MNGGDETGAVPTNHARQADAGIRLIARNGMLAAAQVVLTSVGYLFAYRVMGATVGIEVIGSWSLCLAIGSVATLADLGASDGLARTVAERAAATDSGGLRRVLVTGIVFCSIACLAGGLICYAVAKAALPRVLSDPAALATTLAVLAPALIVAGLNALGLSCQGVLEGLERYQLRFVAGVAATIVFVASIMLLVPAAGLAGVVWAYLAQAGTLLAISGTLCFLLTRGSSRGSNGPSLGLLRELVKVGLPMRATGLVTLLLDPLTRVAVTYFGGTASAGYYEVASRLVLQLRTVIVAGFQAGLPRLVKLATLGSANASQVTGQTYRGGLSIAVAAFTMAILVGPFIFQFVLGRVPPLGMQFFVMLCAGWCINAISAPFFFSLVAKRRVAALWLSSAVMGVANVTLFGLLGRLFGAQGVVASLAISIAAGSLVTIVAALRLDTAVPRRIQGPELLLLVASAAAIAAFVGPNLRAETHSVAVAPLLFATALYALIFLAILHVSGIFRR
jgi:O-antigen/teichoic acid export membrane protein